MLVFLVGLWGFTCGLFLTSVTVSLIRQDYRKHLADRAAFREDREVEYLDRIWELSA
jgi:hypothetical protein